MKMKRVSFAAAVALVALFALVGVASAEAPLWKPADNTVVLVLQAEDLSSSTWTLRISEFDETTGEFTGSLAPPDFPAGYPRTGSISGDSLLVNSPPPGSLSPSYQFTGTIASDGSASGDVLNRPGGFVFFTFSTAAGEFVPIAQEPASISDCRSGGWMTVVDVNGDQFVNVGDCIAYVASGGRNLAGVGR